MAAAALLGAKATGEETAGAIKQVLDALNKDLISFHWAKNPRTHKLELVSVDVKITVGFVLGGAALALLWEIANWFAQSGIGQATNAENVPDIIGLLTLNPVAIALTDLFGNPILNSDGSKKTVTAPPTFGAAFNTMMRNLTVAGPGQLALTLVNLVGNATTGGGTGGTTTGSSSGTTSAPGGFTGKLIVGYWKDGKWYPGTPHNVGPLPRGP
jgi:hypothetical protein